MIVVTAPVRRRTLLRGVLLGGALAGAAQGAGCTGGGDPGRADVPDPGREPVPGGPVLAPPAPLTGLPVNLPGIATRPAIAVPLRIGAGARNPAPAGLDAADLLFQEYAENDSLRVLALFQSRDAGRIGPVTGIRPADVRTLFVFRPFVAYDGGPAVDQLDDTRLPTVSRDKRGDLFPDGYTATTALYPLVPAGAPPPSMLSYAGSTDPLTRAGAKAAKTLTVRPPGRAAQTWQYDEAGRAWRGTLGGVPLTVATVVVLTVPYRTPAPRSPDARSPAPDEAPVPPTPDVIGDGDALAVSGGWSAKGRWRKPAQRQMCGILDSTGAPMRPQPGAAWIVWAPPGSTVTVA